MNVEIVEFYPSERNEKNGDFKGTLRIKLPDIGIHILGVLVSKHNGFWFFSLPGRKSKHHETGEEVRYPFIGFENREQQKELISAIREKGRAFVEARLADTTNPIVWPPQKNGERITKKQVGNGCDNRETHRATLSGSSMDKVCVTPSQPVRKTYSSFGSDRLK